MASTAEVLVLARYARACIRAALGGPTPASPPGVPFDAPGATFVSLHWPDGRLQGCIGSLDPTRTLADDVAHNAWAAAFDDPRARPLAPGDVESLEVEVSILSPRERLPSHDQAAVRAALRPGRDGVLLRWHRHRATFLPQVWSQLGDAETFLAELKQKAGLPPDFWADDVVVERYEVAAATDRRHGA